MSEDDPTVANLEEDTQEGTPTSLQDSQDNQPTEIDTLKQRADLMGINYHPSIGVDKLRTKINSRLKDTDSQKSDTESKKEDPGKPGKPDSVVYLTEDQYKNKSRISVRKRAAQLVRIRVTCMNPNKKEWEGEIISVGSSKVGTFKKFIPFNVEDGYHVPYIIYQALKERKCTIFQTVRGPRGEKIRRGKLIPEFSIDVLPALTSEELEDLAKQQAMAGTIG